MLHTSVFFFRIKPRYTSGLEVFDHKGHILRVPQLERVFGFVGFNGYSRLFLATDISIQPETWHHLCYSVKQADNVQTLKVALDGRLVANTEFTDHDIHTFNLTSTFRIGHSNPMLPLNGMLTDFNAWERPLTDDQMTSFTGQCASISDEGGESET